MAKRFYDVYFRQKVDAIYPTVVTTGETHNFTYDLTDANLRYLTETVACATGLPAPQIQSYIEEALGDQDLNRHVLGATSRLDVKSPFGRRLGWYAIARALKPSVIVETGVERGHGAVLLCAALLRNAGEGRPGRYYGTDIRPEAGVLFTAPYSEAGKILYGDSIESLRALNETIDLFINDSDHSDEYEYREYHTIANKLSPAAIILGDNAHVTDKLAIFSRETGRRFLFFKEVPANHWYPGAGIGISFP